MGDSPVGLDFQGKVTLQTDSKVGNRHVDDLHKSSFPSESVLVIRPSDDSSYHEQDALCFKRGG